MPLAPSDSNAHNDFWIPSPEDFVVPMPLNMDTSMHVPPPNVNAHMGMMPDLGCDGYADGMDPLSRMFDSYEWDSYGSAPSTSSGSGQNHSPLPITDFSGVTSGQNNFYYPTTTVSSTATSPVYDNPTGHEKFFTLNLNMSTPSAPTPSPYGSHYNTPVEPTNPHTWCPPQQHGHTNRVEASDPAPPPTGSIRQWAA